MPKGKWPICTTNSNTWGEGSNPDGKQSGAKRLIESIGTHLFPEVPDFLAIQETRLLNQQQRTSAESWAHDHGYKLHFGPSRITGTTLLSTSGGVAVGCRNHIGMEVLTPATATQEAWQAALIHALIPKGFILISLYLRNGLDPVILEEIAVFLKAQNGNG